VKPNGSALWRFKYNMPRCANGNLISLLAALRKIEARGTESRPKTETAHKTKELCGRIFMYGIATGRCERNVAADLKLALKPRAGKNLAAITEPAKVGQLLRALDAYPG